MIVAYNALSLRPGVDDGGATYSLNLLRHLPRALGDDVEVVVYTRQGETRVPPAPNLRVTPVPLPTAAPPRLAVELFGLGRLLQRGGAELLLSPHESIPLRLPCPAVVIAQNVAYHCDAAGAFGGRTAWQRAVSQAQAAYYRRGMSSAYDRAAAVITCSEFAAELLERRAGLDRAKTRVVFSGSDGVAPATEARRADRLLVVASLAPYKKLTETLELFALLRTERPQLELVIAGGDWRGYGSVVEAEVRRLGIGDKVRLLGRVDGKTVAELYATSLALLHLSTCESFGLPLVEAMLYGLPVVAADRGPSPEIAAGAALLVDPDELAAAAAAVSALLASPAQRERLVGAGRKRAGELTWARTADAIADVLRATTDRRS